jgi:sugar O-acyltransferase (sialic acid O-acetyltransferase NeuD family)|tara:strand:+ start:845 stop:1438 length:594 start_codon:yes stop_codon:yes gene_type:complete
MAYKKKIFVFGSGGHAKSCIDIINSTKLYKIDTIIYEKIFPKDKIFLKYKKLQQSMLNKNYNKFNAIIGIGQIKNNSVRKKIFKLLLDKKFNLDPIISANSHISNFAKIGIGSIVMHWTMLGSNVFVGKNCIINNGSLVEHDVQIGDHCHVSTRCVLNGGVKIGNDCFIGSGTIIKEGITIKSGSIIPMGSIISKNV